MPKNADSLPDSQRSPIDRASSPIAEIIAVGDEMTSGQRLDTNTQWLAIKLNELGIAVEYHSTVGDDLARQTDVIRTAAARANIVIITGGLGPTQDDLTRRAIADAANVELKTDAAALEHIKTIFARNNRVMAESNRSQAQFPLGGSTIHNEEGTAPGVDFECRLNANDRTHRCRIFALPGVPYEMKQMWSNSVEPAVSAIAGRGQNIMHHVVRCFGVGESQAEEMMPELIARNRSPRVGITASLATISFRITATAESTEICRGQIESTVDYIKSVLGNVVFGEGEDTLQDVTAALLLESKLNVSLVDFQFGGAAASLLRNAKVEPAKSHPLNMSLALQHQRPRQWVQPIDASAPLMDSDCLRRAAIQIQQHSSSNIGIAIGPLFNQQENQTGGEFEAWITFADGSAKLDSVNRTFSFGGHSSMREIRSAKQVIDFLRQTLQAIE